MDTSEFREAYGELVDRAAEYDKNHFNIFTVFRLNDYEIRHSNFIKWLFYNDEFKKAFLKKFAEIRGLRSDIANAAIEAIEREKSFNEVDKYGKPIKRFAFVARQYYLQLKKEFDSKIRTALADISNDPYYIKDDYNRGGYAITIPLKDERYHISA